MCNAAVTEFPGNFAQVELGINEEFFYLLKIKKKKKLLNGSALHFGE